MSPPHLTSPPLSKSSMADLLCTIMMLSKGIMQDGQPYWAYVCIKPSMAKSYSEAREQGNFNLEDYGTIIEWGVGDEVPVQIQRKMEQQFGMRHDFEDILLRAIEAYA